MRIKKFKFINLLIKNWLQIILSFAGVGVIVFMFNSNEHLEPLISVLIAIFSAIFLLQKHNWDKKKIYHELFSDFNRRYDTLNENMNRIKEGKLINMINIVLESDLSKPDEVQFYTTSVIYDYLNLCGEEYFWAGQKMLHPEIWDNWKKGIEYFINCPIVIKVIKMEIERYNSNNRKDKKVDNYYGFLSSDIVNNALNNNI